MERRHIRVLDSPVHNKFLAFLIQIKWLRCLWELNRMICNRENGKICEDCVVYISKKTKKK